MATPRSTPRSLTQMLRDSDDESIRALMMARPDLAVPAPTTFSQVASRATTRESVRAALDSLNALDLWVAQRASAATGAVSAADIDGVDAAAAELALDRLRRLALLWGDAGALRPVRALATELARSPLAAPPAPTPPSFDDAAREDPRRVNEVAAGSAFELVRRLEVLVEHTDHTALRLRQDGGLAQREARLVGSLLDLPVAIALTHTQIAQAAGLIGVVPQGRTDTLIPTSDFDSWQGLRLADQWAWLVRGWVEGHPPSGSAKLKALCFEAFGPPSEARVIGTEHLQRWLGWQLPRLAEESNRRATTLLTQAAWVGVTGLGALASFGGNDIAALEALLPARADKVLLQNDLTAVAPGPLTPSASRELGAIADVESRGGATVYRFSVESLRRAHSVGWSAQEIQSTLEARSRTPIPQPLSYLIADLDRARAVASIAAPGDLRPPSAMSHQQPVRAQVTPLAGVWSGSVIDLEMASHIVKGLRHVSGPETGQNPSDLTAAEGMADSPLETLREAVETGELVWIGYVDTRGSTGERLVYASAVEEGRVLARDSRTAERLTVPVHRITAAHIIRGGSV